MAIGLPSTSSTLAVKLDTGRGTTQGATVGDERVTSGRQSVVDRSNVHRELVRGDVTVQGQIAGDGQNDRLARQSNRTIRS